MVDRKKPKVTSSKSSTKSSKEALKVLVPAKKSESKIDGVGEFECSSIVSPQKSFTHLVCARDANFYYIGRS
jgi:hypothetical protein